MRTDQTTISLSQADDSLSVLRIIRPEQIRSMESSLGKEGQLYPVVARFDNGKYQLLDGFKRYYAANKLDWQFLMAQLVEVDEQTAKSLIISYNQRSRSLVDYEEALIVHSLKCDHLLNQEAIAGMLSRSISWVSRRLSLIERLDQTVRSHLQLGKLTSTHARELIKLPRGKQVTFAKAILDHNLTSRQTQVLMRQYLQSNTEEQQAALLTHPLEAIERFCKEEEVYDSRLGRQGNRLLKTLRMLSQCQHVLIGQSTNPPLQELPETELDILGGPIGNVVKKMKILDSILKPYHCNERRSPGKQHCEPA